MQIPEQLARDVVVQEYGEIELTRTNVLVDGARLVELIALGIKASLAQQRGRLDDLYAYDHTRPDGEKFLIVEIDTPEDVGQIRVCLNDYYIYSGDPEEKAE